ncbi:MAG: hypothetical protein K9J21_10025 [Bacteroidales bacterium]|nr:hypothetical protein [Bacteroidales bacterium]
MTQNFDKNMRFFLLISLFFLIKGSLNAQVVRHEKEKFSANNIEHATMYRCDFVFGKIDSCRIIRIKKLDRDGNVIKSTYSPGSPHEHVSKYKYDNSGNRYKSIKISSGDTATYLKDFNDSGKVLVRRKFKNNTLINISRYEYEYEDGRQTLVRSIDSAGNLNYLNKRKYDTAGNEIEWIYFNGTDTSITRKKYNEENKLIRTVHKNYSGEVSETEYFYENDTIVLQKTRNHDGSVNSRKYKYDDKRRLIKEVYSFGGNQNQEKTIKYAYNEDNRIIKKSSSDKQSPGKLRVTYYTYNDADIINSVLLQYENKSANIKKRYSYYPDGKLKEMIEYKTRNDSILHQYEYDKAGNKVQEIKKERTDNRLKKYKYNTSGEVIAKTEYLLVKDDTILFDKVKYKYGPDNRLDYKDFKNYLMIAAINRHMQADSLKKYADIIEKRYLIKYKMKHEYDDRGNLVKVWEDKGASSSDAPHFQSHFYKYNDNNRLIEDVIFYTSSGDTIWKKLYKYDSKGKRIREKVVNMNNQERVMKHKHFFYDSDDKLTKTLIYHPDNKIDRRRFYYNSEGKVIKETTFVIEKEYLKRYRYKTF